MILPFGRKLPVLFERCGLENLRHEATAEVVRGGSLWARWWQKTLEAMRGWEQGRHELTKVREEEYKALTAPWADPSFWFLNPLVHACWSQRPEHQQTSSGMAKAGSLSPTLSDHLANFAPIICHGA
jgi:hypothetical protein